MHRPLGPRAIAAALLLALASGCAGFHPLGDDWEQLEPAAREVRAREALGAVFTGGVDGVGEAFEDREVLRCDAAGVEYRLESGETTALRWADVEAVESTPLSTLPARPETLFVYLTPDSPSARAAKDVIVPPLADLGLARPYILLRSRPRWSRAQVTRALSYLTRRPVSVPAAEPVATTAPVESAGPATGRAGATSRSSATAPGGAAAPEAGSPARAAGDPPPAGGPAPADLDALEAKLERLREWHTKGLLDDEEYQREKRELLEGL